MIREPNWEDWYRVLDDLRDSLILPKDTFTSYGDSIDSALRVETKLTTIFTKVQRYVVDAKQSLDSAKRIYKLRLQALIYDREFQDGRTKKERELYAEAHMVEEQKEVDKWQDRVNRYLAFNECLLKVLSVCKHIREDINKKIKVLEISQQLEK